LAKNKLEMPSATVWLLDGSLLNENDLVFFARQLGASETRRYARFLRGERRLQFLLGRMLLRVAVANLLSLPPDTLDIVERVGNAPQLVLPDSQMLQPHFSLSHSRNWVACAVSAGAKLGIDIEVNDPTRDVLRISQLAFHPNEQLWLLRQLEFARLAAFYHLWCTREALYKLMCSLGRQTFLSPLVGTAGIFASQGPGWHRYTSHHSALMLAICSDQPLSALQKFELTRFTREDWLVADRAFLAGHAMS
jgi:4'-phosphopantetheinyl transferase